MLLEKIHAYIVDHDNRWSFMIAYVSFALVLALVFNLFWLCLVMGVHGVFEWIKLRQEYDDWRMILTRVLWELKLDLALVIFALALGIYLEAVLGMLGLGHTARAAAQAGGRMAGRAAAWQNALRGALLSLDDVAQVARFVVAKNSAGADGDVEGVAGADGVVSGEGGQPEAGEPTILGPWVRPYGLGDKISLGFGALCTALVLVSPYITEHEWSDVVEVVIEEFHPLPFLGDGASLEE